MTKIHPSKSQLKRMKVGDLLPTNSLAERVLAKAPAGLYIGQLNRAGLVNHDTVRFLRTD